MQSILRILCKFRERERERGRKKSDKICGLRKKRVSKHWAAKWTFSTRMRRLHIARRNMCERNKNGLTHKMAKFIVEFRELLYQPELNLAIWLASRNNKITWQRVKTELSAIDSVPQATNDHLIANYNTCTVIVELIFEQISASLVFAFFLSFFLLLLFLGIKGRSGRNQKQSRN